MSKWIDIPKSDFLKAQLDFPRVRDAFQKKEVELKKLLLRQEIKSFNIDFFLRAFKQEQVLEIWAKAKAEQNYKLIESYPFCANSGALGPKRKEGDRQIPEGFYYISHYNPKSNFLLSLKVNYPNDSDKILSDPEQPGDDIYIHGGCQTVGCIPLTDDKIQEVYLLSVLAKTEGASIPIHIFPFRMNTKNLQKHVIDFPEHVAFWNNLKEGFDFFQQHKTLPIIRSKPDGTYHVFVE